MSTSVYTAPESGTYVITNKKVHLVLNGKTRLIKNHSRKWFQFWKPRMLEVPDFNLVADYGIDYKELKLKKGDTIPISFNAESLEDWSIFKIGE